MGSNFNNYINLGIELLCSALNEFDCAKVIERVAKVRQDFDKEYNLKRFSAILKSNYPISYKMLNYALTLICVGLPHAKIEALVESICTEDLVNFYSCIMFFGSKANNLDGEGCEIDLIEVIYDVEQRLLQNKLM